MFKFIISLIFFVIPITLLSQSYENNFTWQALGPFYSTLEKNYKHLGRAESVWVNPTDTSQIFLGTSTSGLWFSENGGVSWKCMTEDMLCGVNDILVNPDNFDEIYLATGTYVNGLQAPGFYGDGILKSTDKGKTWQILDLNISHEDKMYFSNIVFHPKNTNILYALARNTLYKSEDKGLTWKKLKVNSNPDEDHTFYNITFKPSNPDVIVLSGKNVLYRTKNGGKKWANIFDNYCNFVTKISACYGDSDTLYAISLDSAKTSNFLKKSVDDGNSWTEKKINLWAKNYIMSLWTQKNGNLFVGGIYLMKSSDYGNGFKDITGQMHVDIRNIYFPDNENLKLIYSVTDGGIYKTVDGGKKWQNINSNLNITQCYSIGICQMDTNFLITGTHDNGTYLLDSSGVWQHIFGGDGGVTLINSQNPEISYFVYNSSGGNVAIRRRERKTISKDLFYSPQICDFPIIESHSNSNIIYAATQSSEIEGYDSKVTTIIRSFDNGLTFEDPKTPYGYGLGLLTAMDECEDFPKNFYFTTFDNVNKSWGYLRRTSNGGKTWETVNETFFKSLINEYWVTDLEVHPSDPDKVWITMGGFLENTKVLYSRDGGTNWISLTYNLENYPVNEIEYYKPLDLLIIGTDIGVYFMDSDNKEWKELGFGLPTIIVSDMKINYITGELYISTYGRGLWKIKLAE